MSDEVKTITAWKDGKTYSFEPVEPIVIPPNVQCELHSDNPPTVAYLLIDGVRHELRIVEDSPLLLTVENGVPTITDKPQYVGPDVITIQALVEPDDDLRDGDE